jgi:putative oxidoreductase
MGTSPLRRAPQIVPPGWLVTGLLPLVARLAITGEFIIAALGKALGWSGQAAYMASQGMTLIGPLLGAALLIEAVGSLCLITGFKARPAAAIMFVYLGIVSVRLHGFWHMTGMAAGTNETHFFKNLGMMGGLLMIVAYGPGRWALDRRRQGTTASSIKRESA